ncbi:uncharacterized protein LOC134705508 [Mytilus trossulus]|uniref:uncharacterized protein LOC134705508 n=1 Tax=Mytilus trossulus TaxID=6551 RepID=UPI003005377E
MIRTKKESFNTLREFEEDDRQRLKKELKQRKQFLISIIESKYGKLTADLQEMYQNSNKQKETEIINQSLIKLRDKQASLGEIVKTSNVEEFVKSFNILNEEIKKLLQNIPDEKQVSFQPGISDIHFGSFGYKSKTTEIKNISSLTSLETVRIIQTNHNEVDMICPNSNDTTWIGGQNDARVQLIQNSSGQSIKEIETNVSNGCVRSDILYLCCLNEKSVLAISLDGTVTTIKEMQPLYPVCIYVTSTDDIRIGAISELDNYDLESKNRRVVITMNDKGEVRKELSQDVNGIKLFVKPYRCIVNELNNELVVLDKTSGGNGRVVCISPNDEIKFRYFGRSSDELAYEFNPLGIDIATNYIIVLDFSNHALDIVNDEGYMIKWVSIEMNEICSLAFDSAGQLWLGNHDKTRAEIFITRLK